MSDNIRKVILKYIEECTKEFCSTKKLSGSTIKIAEENFVSRSLVSQYLNEMNKEGELIKINSRPVYFLSRKIIEKTFKISIKEESFDCLDDLLQKLDERILSKGIFIDAIGSDGSLNYCIHQMISAVSYPPNGLPILIIGDKGTGKTYLSNLIYKHCFHNGIIQENNIFRYVISKNEQNIITNQKIFGYKENGKIITGLLDKSNSSVLLIENLHCADEGFVQQLISYLKNGYYVLGDKIMHSSARIILTAREENLIVETIKNELPICCTLPTLKERSFSEREALVINQFLIEQNKICKNIYISSGVFYALIHHNYNNNIKELQSIIISLCAKAFNDYVDDVYIKSYHLPFDFWEESNVLASESDSYIKVDQYVMEEQSDSIFVYFEIILNLYNKYSNGLITEKEFEEECYLRMEDYYDCVEIGQRYNSSSLKSFESAIKKIADYIFNHFQLLLPTSFIHVLTKSIYKLAYNNGRIIVWQEKNKTELLCFQEYLKDKCMSAYMIASEIKECVYKELDIELDIANFIFVILNVYRYNVDASSLKYQCLIAAHGYSTASSMADAVNKMIGSHIFDGIDMPLDASFQEVKKLIQEYLSKYFYKKDILILVDMGSLEQLDEISLYFNDVNLAIINHVSTGLALDVALKVKQEMNIELIAEECSKNSISTYKLNLAKKKPSCIIFTTEVGETATERVLQLFRDSIPRSIDLSIISYSYNRLLENGNDDDVFKLNQVIFVVGMSQIKDLNIPFVSLEDMITFSDFDLVTSLLSDYMDQDELKIFNDNMLKNFSLISILDNVTILNASKLYDKISKAVERLERVCGINILNKIKVGMYIHISCLVERLVMHYGEESTHKVIYEDNDESLKFSKAFMNSFSDVMDYYRIEFPLDEVYYIYTILEPYLKNKI